MEVVDGAEYLLDGLGGVFLGELALLADAVEQLAARGQLRDYVEFVLQGVAAGVSQLGGGRSAAGREGGGH